MPEAGLTIELNPHVDVSTTIALWASLEVRLLLFLADSTSGQFLWSVVAVPKITTNDAACGPRVVVF
jgi:hypothetical protein